jgi:hypothetical protein
VCDCSGVGACERVRVHAFVQIALLMRVGVKEGIQTEG